MSNLTYKEARDSILAQFKAVWDNTGHKALYDDVEGSPPETEVAWARVTMAHAAGGIRTLGGVGCRRFGRVGVVTVQIFTLKGQGLSLSDDLAKTVADAFEGKATPEGVWFRNVSPPNEIGSDGNWFQVNITANFDYDEIK